MTVQALNPGHCRPVTLPTPLWRQSSEKPRDWRSPACSENLQLRRPLGFLLLGRPLELPRRANQLPQVPGLALVLVGFSVEDH